MSDAIVIDASVIDELFRMDTAIEGGGGLVENPWPSWKELQAQGPVHEGTIAECMGLPRSYMSGMASADVPYYSVFSFSAVSEVFTRKDDFWSDNYHDTGTAAHFGDTILSMDGLRHRRYRNIIQHFFQPGSARSWWRDKVIDPFVEAVLDSFAAERSIDINSRFFALLPQHTMTSGFGLSFEQGLELRRHMLNTLHAPTVDERHASTEAAGRMMHEAITERQREARDDLISRLAHTPLEEEDGSTRLLTTEEITSFCRLIVFAGGETTWRMMGLAFYSLLNHPDQLAAVKADRSLIESAVLESVRWHPEPIFPRKVKRDTVLQGVALPAGAHLQLCIGAANRDPTRWENPDTFDVRRPFQRSVAFAAGAHSCLGQHVARQELEAAFGALFDRFPDIRWDTSKPPTEITGSLVQRGPGAMHVLLR